MMRSDNIPPFRAFQQASALHMQGQLEEAEQLYRTALVSDEFRFPCTYRLGIIRLQQDNVEDAENYFYQSIELDRNVAEAHHHHGITLLRLGRPEEAIRRFQSAVDIKPKFAEAQDALG